MPVLTVEIPTPGTTINRQLITSVVENIMRNMGIDNNDVLFLGGAYDNASQPDSTIGEKRDISFTTCERTFIEVDERRIDGGGFERAVGYDLEAPLFWNRRYQVKCIPNYVSYECTVTVKRRAPARSMLGGWTNELQRKIDMGMDTFVTDGTFSYRIPIPTLNLLAATYRALSHNVDIGELRNYLRSGFHDGVTVVANDAGKGLTFMSRTTATRIVGQFEPNITRQKDGEGGAWSSEFTYRFIYSRPEAIVMSYPAMLNNRLIDEQWWHETNAPGVSDESFAAKGVRVGMQDHIVALPDRLAIPVFVPKCDREIPNLQRRHREEVDIFAGYLEFEIDEVGKDTHFAFNVKDLGEVGFRYNQLTYLRLLGKEDPHMLDCLIHVNLFKDGYELEKHSVAIDSNLDVWFQDEFNIKSVYQFSITMETSLENLSDEGKDLASKVPGVIGDIIEEFHPELADKYPEWGDVVPRPPSPDCPDLPEYPFDIVDPVPPNVIDPDTWKPIDPDNPDINPDWEVDENGNVVYPEFPDKPVYPGDYTPPTPPDIVDDMVEDTITDIIDPRDPSNTSCSVYQLTIFDGTIIARVKE